MISEKVQKRLALLDINLVKQSDSEFHLTEKDEAGIADLHVYVEDNCILFCNLEKKKNEYLLVKSCADYVLFQVTDNVGKLYVFELKRTISESSWEKIKHQFEGAMQNALALAGLLGIEMDLRNTQLFSVFRNDKLNDFSNPAKQRLYMHEHRNLSQKHKDWNDEKIKFEFLDSMLCTHKKIQLHIEDGTGEYILNS